MGIVLLMVDCIADCIVYGGMLGGLYFLWCTAWRIELLMMDCMADCIVWRTA
jgi:hypothetical protein